MTTPDIPPTDRDLLAATRAGSTEAWGELRARHEPAVAALARHRGRGARAATQAAMRRLQLHVVEGDLDLDAGTPAVRAVRPMALAALTGGTYGPVAVGSGADGETAAVDVGAPARAAPDPTADITTARRLARAFAELPAPWQTVLWHRWVEAEPAAMLAVPLGRPPADVVALERVAEAGLYDRYLGAVLADADDPAECRPIVAQLGGYVRDRLPASERRAIDAHRARLDATGHECERHLAVAATLAATTPAAIAPGITGMPVDGYRALTGVGVGALGTAALAAERSQRRLRRARLVAVLGVLAALVAAAVLIRPLGDLDTEIAELLERAPPTTSVPGAPSGPAPTGPPTAPTPGAPTAEPSRIELVFPGALQGIRYVPGPEPLALSVSLSMPAPAYAGGTATVDAAITNAPDGDPDVRFVIRVSPGISFDELADGAGDCDPAAGGGAACRIRIEPGSTGSMSLRFALVRDLPERLVVAPNVPSDVLDVPIEVVDDLVLGTVDRGELLAASGRFVECDDDCERRSSIEIDWRDGASVATAIVAYSPDVLDGERAPRLDAPDGTSTVVSPATETAQDDAASAPAVVDVTDVVAAAGPGRYTFDRGDGTTPGSWSLLVVVADPAAPRRLFVAIQPDVVVVRDEPLRVDVPVAAPVGPPPSRSRPVRVRVSAEDVDGARLQVADRQLGGDRPFAVGAGTVRSYALPIAPDTEFLRLEAATTTSPFRLSVLTLGLDIVT